MTPPATPSLGALMLLAAAGMAAQQQATAPPAGWPCVAAPDPSYVAIAEATGGQVFLLDPSEVAESAPLTIARDRHEETLFRAGGTLEDGMASFDVPVDSTVESLLVSVSLQCLQVVEVARPSGALVQAADVGVAYHQLQAVRLITVRRPEPGAWTVRIAGRGATSVAVQARSAIALDSVQFVERGGRPGHEGWFPRSAPPLPRRPTHVRAVVSGPAGSLRLELERQQLTGADHQPVTPVVEEAEADRRELIGEVAPRLGTFRVVAAGRDASGHAFRRVHAPLFQTAR